MKLNIQDIGVIIAERKFDGDENGTVCHVVVKIGKPFPDGSHEGCWYCPYSIDRGTDQRLFYGAGVDSLQALRIAITMIDADLKSRYKDLNLTWMGEGDLGLIGKV